MRKPLTDREIIHELGVEALTALGHSEESIKKWRKRGIPWRMRAAVAKLAKANRIRLPEDFLSERKAA